MCNTFTGRYCFPLGPGIYFSRFCRVPLRDVNRDLLCVIISWSVSVGVYVSMAQIAGVGMRVYVIINFRVVVDMGVYVSIYWLVGCFGWIDLLMGIQCWCC